MEKLLSSIKDLLMLALVGAILVFIVSCAKIQILTITVIYLLIELFKWLSTFILKIYVARKSK